MDLDFLKDLDPEALNKRVDAAMKGVNDIGNTQLSKECLDLVNEARAGTLKLEDVNGIAEKLLKKHGS